MNLFIGILAVAGAFRRKPPLRSLAVPSALASVLGLGFLIAFGSSLATRSLTGLWQRLTRESMTDPVARLTAAIADRYRIERELGEGGMVTVYLA